MAVCIQPDALPVLLVSAADRTAAVSLINEITKDSKLDQSEHLNTIQFLWTIKNKYYEANISIHISTDDERIPWPSPDAHIIFVQDSKGEGVEEAEARRVACRGERAGAEGVLLLVCEASPATSALAAWARAHRYELVELQERAPSDDDDEPFAEQYGAARAVGALHAHVWPGLCRLDRPRITAPTPARVLDSDEELQLERAEEFAELLGRLDTARSSARDAADDERRARAEHLVGAFCRALGFDPDTL